MRPQILCLTPVRNEASRLAAFLDLASTWADGIIVADQRSDDGSREIARTHPKVVLVDNPDGTLDESERQRLLLDAARSAFPGDRVLLLIDADEALTAGARDSDEWSRVFDAAPGTAIRMPWIHPLPGGRQAWRPARPKRFGVVDDGRPGTTRYMHAGRLPASDVDEVVLDSIAVVHFQHLDPESWRAKQRWYQAWHHLRHPDLPPGRVYRRYHRAEPRRAEELVPMEPVWLGAYEDAGMDVESMGRGAGAARWDAMTLELIVRYGPERFRRLDLWDHDWSAAAAQLGVEVPDDPRRWSDRYALRVLSATQSSRHGAVKGLARRAVALAGW